MVKDGPNEPRSCSFTDMPLSAKCSELHYSTVSKMKSDKVKYFFHHLLPGSFLKGWIIHPFKSSTAKDEGALTSSQVYWFLEHSLHMMGASNGDGATEVEMWAQIKEKKVFFHIPVSACKIVIPNKAENKIMLKTEIIIISFDNRGNLNIYIY